MATPYNDGLLYEWNNIMKHIYLDSMEQEFKIPNGRSLLSKISFKNGSQVYFKELQGFDKELQELKTMGYRNG